MRVLLVKLSSLGDVIHTLPVVHDLHQAFPGIEIDWVVEPSFASVLQMHPGLRRIVPCALREWRRARFNATARAQMRAFWSLLRQESYDAVFDLQGLSKSALVARVAKLSPQGVRFAMANRTLGSSYEPLTRWLAQQSIALNPRLHALQRARQLCAQALHYNLPGVSSYGLVVSRANARAHTSAAASPGFPQTLERRVAFLMGTSRSDKTWPLSHWVELGERFNASGFEVCFVHGSQSELEQCERVAAQLVRATIWPRSTLIELAQGLMQAVGAVGVDSGLSHLSVALDLVHVQIYRFDTAWRTGPLDCAYQRSVFQPQVCSQASRQVTSCEGEAAENAHQSHPAHQAHQAHKASQRLPSVAVDEVWLTWCQCLDAKAASALSTGVARVAPSPLER